MIRKCDIQLLHVHTYCIYAYMFKHLVMLLYYYINKFQHNIHICLTYTCQNSICIRLDVECTTFEILLHQTFNRNLSHLNCTLHPGEEHPGQRLVPGATPMCALSQWVDRTYVVLEKS